MINKKYYKLRLFVASLLACLLLPCALGAQQIERAVVGSCGNSVESGQIEMSWTIGEVAIASFVSEDVPELFLSQGFHQTAEEIETNTIELSFGSLRWEVYPNPAQDQFYIEAIQAEKYSFALFDVTGKLIRQNQVATGKNLVDVSDLVPALYFLKISNHSGSIKNIKIQIQ